MAEAVDRGQRVVCLTATRGEAGFPEPFVDTVEARKSIRERELDACLAVLGVKEHLWLDYADGGCDRAPLDAAVDAVAAVIADVAPDTVLTFPPSGLTWHVDHIAISRWTTLAFRRAARPGARLLYAAKTDEWQDQFLDAVDLDDVMMVEGARPPTTPVAELALWYRCDEEMADRKVEAMLCQPSQVEMLREQAGADSYRELIRDEFFRLPAPDDW